MITVNISKWWHAVIAATPLLAMVATTAMWIDTRYMHREISERQYINLQYDMIEYHVRSYKKLIEEGHDLTVDEEMDYEARQRQLEFLEDERNRIMGLRSNQ